MAQTSYGDILQRCVLEEIVLDLRDGAPRVHDAVRLQAIQEQKEDVPPLEVGQGPKCGCGTHAGIDQGVAKGYKGRGCVGWEH